MKPLHLIALVPIMLLPSCESFLGKSQNTVTKTVQRIVGGEVVEQTTTTEPYVDPQRQGHADATKTLFSE